MSEFEAVLFDAGDTLIRLSGSGEKFIAAPLRSLALRLATTRPSRPATMSPLRKVGSSSTLTGASPTASLPLQVQPATISLR